MVTKFKRLTSNKFFSKNDKNRSKFNEADNIKSCL